MLNTVEVSTPKDSIKDLEHELKQLKAKQKMVLEILATIRKYKR